MLRIGRLAGIPIGIHPLWLLIVGLIAYSLGHDYFPSADGSLGTTAAYALGLLSALMLFAGILLHELGHAVVARRHGITVEEIDLWMLGGVARLAGEAKTPADELRFAAAGPAVTAVIAAVLGIVRLSVGASLPDWGRAAVDYQLYVNGAILVLNLLPAFPLDGGRILRSLLWRQTGDRERATATAARAGRMFGWGFMAVGAFAFFSGYAGGLWFALIGGFLVVASGAEAQSSRVECALRGRTVGQLMSAPAFTLGADATLADAVTTGFARHLFSAFPVVDGTGKAVGLLTLDDVRRVPEDRRAVTLVAAAVHRDADLLVSRDSPAAELLKVRAFQRLGRAVVVDDHGGAIGLLSVTDLERRLRADGLLPGIQRPHHA